MPPSEFDKLRSTHSHMNDKFQIAFGIYQSVKNMNYRHQILPVYDHCCIQIPTPIGYHYIPCIRSVQRLISV